MDHPGTPQVVKPKIGKNMLTCGVMLLGTILMVSAGIGYLVSESGLMRVPFFSRWYIGPKSAHPVQVVPMDAERLQASIVMRLQEEIALHPESPYVVRLSEGELSGALADTARDVAKNRSLLLQNVQVAVLPSGLEGSGEISRGPLHVHLLTSLGITVDSGILRVKAKGLQIGDIHLPASFAEHIFSALFSRGLGEWNMNFGGYVLREVRVLDGYIELVIDRSA